MDIEAAQTAISRHPTIAGIPTTPVTSTADTTTDIAGAAGMEAGSSTMAISASCSWR